MPKFLATYTIQVNKSVVVVAADWDSAWDEAVEAANLEPGDLPDHTEVLDVTEATEEDVADHETATDWIRWSDRSVFVEFGEYLGSEFEAEGYAGVGRLPDGRLVALLDDVPGLSDLVSSGEVKL